MSTQTDNLTDERVDTVNNRVTNSEQLSKEFLFTSDASTFNVKEENLCDHVHNLASGDHNASREHDTNLTHHMRVQILSEHYQSILDGVGENSSRQGSLFHHYFLYEVDIICRSSENTKASC